MISAVLFNLGSVILTGPFDAFAAHELDGSEVLACLACELRPRMVDAVRRSAAAFSTGLLTNNIVGDSPAWSSGSFASVSDLFDVVVESSAAGNRSCASTRSRWT